MDSYTVTLVLGATGLATMAMGGIGRHGNVARGHGHGHAHAVHGHSAHGHAATRGHAARVPSASGRIFWQLTSPRVIFSALLGFGLAGTLMRGVVDGVFRFVVSVLAGILFERLLVTPLFEFALRFASKPARTLETSILDEATVVASFDANGDGIVQIELDGQIVQVLGSLIPTDRARGIRPVAGSRVRVEHVDAARNACSVSLL
jgi:hypothetical protein